MKFSLISSTFVIALAANPLNAQTNETAVRAKDLHADVHSGVREAANRGLAAAMSLNAEEMMQMVAQSPDFRYVDGEGHRFDYAGMRKEVSEWFSGLSVQTMTATSSEVIVLAPDVALYISQGTLHVTLRSGARLRMAPFSLSLLFKRVKGAWLVSFWEESHNPPQPDDPSGSAEAN